MPLLIASKGACSALVLKISRPARRFSLPLFSRTVAALLALASGAQAQQTVVANYTGNSLAIVDFSTGNRTTLSSTSVGTGTALSRPVGTTRDGSGNILVGEDSSQARIFRIDPLTGNRTILSSPVSGAAVGTGPTMTQIYGLATEANGNILATSYSGQAIYRIDPSTGNRTVVTSASVGSGATMRGAFGLLVDLDSSIVFTAYASANEVIRVNQVTGARTVISSATVGTGPGLLIPAGIVRTADGSFVTLNQSDATNYLIRIDPATGNRTVVSGSSVGTGAALSGQRYGLAIDNNGAFYIADFSGNSIVKVDPATGNRTVISSSTVGTGPAFSAPLGMLSGAVGSLTTPVPAVTSLAPASGSSAGGTSVVITGTNLTGATAVKFGPVSATSFSVDSATQVTALSPAGSAGVVHVSVTTGGGTSAQVAGDQFTYSAAATAPGAPTGVSAMAGNTQASVAFTAPVSDGGAAITGYTVTASPGGATATGATSPLVVTGLVNGTSYTFTVTATNNAGTSTASTASAAVIPVTVPGAPTAITATPGNAQASVSFTSPVSSGGAAITGYTVTASPGGATATGATSPLLVTGLANGTSYTFTATATNNAGTSTASTASAAVIPATVPGAPTAVAATRGNAQASVAFTAPVSNGGAAITGYTVTASPGGATATGATSPLVVTGLANGTSYTFTVKATNTSGTGAASTASAAVIPATVPGAPTAVTATAGPIQASVAFMTPATNGGSAITSYTVTASPGGATATGPASPLAVTGLANGTAYTFTVSATNAIGTGAASTASPAITLAPPALLPQSINFATVPDKNATDGAFALAATASSGLPVTFTLVSGPAVLDGVTLTLTGAPGEVVVRASQPGNGTYAAAPEVTRSFAVTRISPLVYFGTLGAGTLQTGSFAAQISPDGKTGTMIGIIPGTGESFVVTFTLDATGNFVAATTTFAGTSSATVSVSAFGLAAASVANGLDPATTKAVSAAATDRIFRGNVIGNLLTGTIDGLTLPFTATLVAPSGPTAAYAGYYRSSSLQTASGSFYSIVGTNGEAYVLAITPTFVGGNSGTAQADGTFVIHAAGATTISGSVDAATTAVTGTLSSPALPSETFSGIAATTTRTDRLIDLSSRARVGPAGERTLITGFVIGGIDSKRVLLRAVGPALAGFGVADSLSNPRLRLYDSANRLLLENDDWSGDETATTAAQVGAFALAVGSRDAAVVATLAPGAYTMHVVDGNETGTALAEIYDASANPQGEYQRLVNISTRGSVDSGDGVLIGGFIVTGNSPKKILVRAAGPALGALGVANFLADPRLTVFRGQSIIAQNDNWSLPTPVGSVQTAATSTEIVAAAQATGAFAFAPGSSDSAVVLTLAPGAYTAQVSGVANATGVALIEIYELP